MPVDNRTILAFNRGIQSRLSLGRFDLERTALGAEVQSNWMPRVLGSMMLRPGTQYLNATRANAPMRQIPFVFATDDSAMLELTSAVMRVRVEDALITRPAVMAVLANGGFDTDLASWTDLDEAGATSEWITGGYLSLTGSGSKSAIREQQVTVLQPLAEHALRIVIERGPVTFRVGSASGLDDYVSETQLRVGTHSLAFQPAGNFFVRFSQRQLLAVRVESIAVEAAGVLELPTPWVEAVLAKVRTSASADVIFVACDGYQQRRIERRTARSWSIVLYQPVDGPFFPFSASGITLTPSAITGEITLTASASLFRSTHVGAIFRIGSSGQFVQSVLTAENTFSDPIRVVGIDAQRAFTVTLAGAFVATATLQYSVGAPGSWIDVTDYTSPVTTSYNDGLDNQIIFYRLGIKSGNFFSGSVVASLTYTSGSITGVVRITGLTSATLVNATVLRSLGGTLAVSVWAEGVWSDRRGWPTCVALHESRLTWFGREKIYGSASDAYETFDDEIEGDSGPIQRSIGEGPVDSIHWALSLSRLIFGTTSAEFSARSSSLDEPLTPANFNLKVCSTQGSSMTEAWRIDKTGVFVQRSGQKLYLLSFDIDQSDFRATDLNALTPDLCEAGIVRVHVQRQPDTRVHCVLADGSAAVLVFDQRENVTAWVTAETRGFIEDVAILPGAHEDQVYYLVRRTVNGETVRYVERWAEERECQGQPEAYLADAHLRYSGAATTTITGLGHLEGATVSVWGWNTATPFVTQAGAPIGRDLGPQVVSGGAISLAVAVTNACVGLPYQARWQSTKQSPLSTRTRIALLGLLLADVHGAGLRYGPDFETLDDLPLDDLPTDEAGEPDLDHVFRDYEFDMTSFNATHGTNARICLVAESPRPCTVLACIAQRDTNARGS